jgi:hypothetical protein
MISASAAASEASTRIEDRMEPGESVETAPEAEMQSAHFKAFDMLHARETWARISIRST